jgi:predicted nucleic acid-binding protein
VSPFLCDTNVLSEVMRREPDAQVKAWFEKLEEVAISVVTIEEIVFGLRRMVLLEKEAWFRRFLGGPVRVVPISTEDALWTGERRGLLARAGRVVTQADALIAAAAWRSGLILATRNVNDFEGFEIPLFNPFPLSVA